MDEDHKFENSHVEDPDSLSQRDKEQSLLSQFEWDDAEEETTEDNQPEFEAISKIMDCVNTIADYVIQNLKTDQAIFGEDDIAIKMYIPIDSSLHSLLQDRYAVRWTEESRLIVFDCVRSMFKAYWNESTRRSLEVTLDEMFPFQGPKQHSIDSIELWDEPVLSKDGSSYGVELLASYVAKTNGTF